MAKKDASSAQPRREPEGDDTGKQKIGSALGLLIENQFAEPSSPCRSYSDLERRTGISREALSRYVTTRSDRRRSPTIDTLATIAGALHLSLEEICRAAAAAAKGAPLPAGEVGRSRAEMLLAVTETLSDAQFAAVIELLRQMHPAGASTSSPRSSKPPRSSKSPR